MACELNDADFEKIRIVGEGAYGTVWQAKKLAGEDAGHFVAVKEICLKRIDNENMMNAILSEMKILQALRHPFIVKFYGSYRSKTHLGLVLDFLSGGELFFHLEKVEQFPEAQARFYAAEIAMALAHLHSQNMIYRDLKPENIVLNTEGHACLTDFGLAKANVPTMGAETLCGTPEYLAPEFLRGEPHNKAVDWWSLGVLLYEMLTGELPFMHDDKDKLWEEILVKPLNWDNPLLSESAKALLKRLLDRDEDARLQSIDEYKKHPFNAPLDFGELLMKKVSPPIVPDQDPAKNFHPAGEE